MKVSVKRNDIKRNKNDYNQNAGCIQHTNNNIRINVSLYCHIFHFLLIAVLAFVGPLSQRQQSAFNNEGKILYSIFHLIFYLAVELTMQQKRTTQFQHLSQTIPGKKCFSSSSSVSLVCKTRQMHIQRRQGI